jgi:hypothetical protein
METEGYLLTITAITELDQGPNRDSICERRCPAPGGFISISAMPLWEEMRRYFDVTRLVLIWRVDTDEIRSL